MCEICIDIGFCDECLRKLKTGTFPFRICNKEHPFVEVYPPKGLVTIVEGEYMVKRNGMVIDAEEWFDTVKEKWLKE
ncbi:hypothetical protein M426DRAFT_154428 [Hypoxylon sp. CI-4A]|nr:hypothetical protein M426DRAFT_154428 [Hypoxylon sp. CI-4A]